MNDESVQQSLYWNRWIFPIVAIISIRMGDIGHGSYHGQWSISWLGARGKALPRYVSYGTYTSSRYLHIHYWVCFLKFSVKNIDSYVRGIGFDKQILVTFFHPLRT